MSTTNKLNVVTLNSATLWTKGSALRQKCHSIDVEDEERLAEAQAIAKEMFRVLYSDPSGVALAAPQVGILKRIVVINYEDRETKEAILHVLINPEIVNHSEETNDANEICLSIPNYMGKVTRYNTVGVYAFDQFGKPITIQAEGFLARVLQHEIDHTNGVLYIDKVEGDLVEIADFYDRRTRPTLKELGLTHLQ